jgi:hypothetical protein
MHKFWEKYLYKFFAQKLLTNFVGCGIMEIRRATIVSAPPKFCQAFSFVQNDEKSQP